MSKKRAVAPEVPSIENSWPGPDIELPRHTRLIVFGDDLDAEAFDRWWDEIGRIDYIGWTTREREWASKRRLR